MKWVDETAYHALTVKCRKIRRDVIIVASVFNMASRFSKQLIFTLTWRLC